MLAQPLFLLLTYLLAAVPFGLVVTTLWGGDQDLRAAGSGNIGATNAARVYGWGLAWPVMAMDIAKGFVPVVLAQLAWPDTGPWWPALVAIVAFVGHCFPVYLEFKGGKGVATGAGAMLAMAPVPTSLAAVVWAAVLAVTGKSSLSALVAVAALVGICLWLEPTMVPIVGLLAVAVAFTHTPNIRRLLRGQESKVIRPVRWKRHEPEGMSVQTVLDEGPAGAGGASPALWKEE